MKKFIYMSALALAFSTVYAQEDTTEDVEVMETTSEESSVDNLSKNGHQLTPKSGDMGLGFDALPLMQYVGDAMNGTTTNTAAFTNYTNDPASIGNTIYLKYFLDDETAARVRLRIGQIATTQSNFVVQDQQVDPDVVVEDKITTANGNFMLGAGLEKRRGNHRIQGVYGGEIAFFRAQTSRIYEYGNGLTETNVNPTSTNWGTGNIISNGERVIANYGGANFGVLLNGFVGVEYFVAPRLSVGGEFTWGFGYTWLSEGEQQTEFYNGAEIENHITKAGTAKVRGFDTGNAGGAINAMFYF